MAPVLVNDFTGESEFRKPKIPPSCSCVELSTAVSILVIVMGPLFELSVSELP